MRYYDDMYVGQVLPEHRPPPLSPADLARYAEASGDRNPLHSDDAHARAAGHGGVIAHGMLVMGQLGRLAVALAGPSGLRAFKARFHNRTGPGESIRYGGTVTNVYEQDGQGLVEAELWARAADGSLKASATLTAALPRR